MTKLMVYFLIFKMQLYKIAMLAKIQNTTQCEIENVEQLENR